VAFLTLTAVGVMGLAGSLPVLMGSEEAMTAHGDAGCYLGSGGGADRAAARPTSCRAAGIDDAEAWAPTHVARGRGGAGGRTWTAEFLPLTVREQRWRLVAPKKGTNEPRSAAAKCADSRAILR